MIRQAAHVSSTLRPYEEIETNSPVRGTAHEELEHPAQALALRAHDPLVALAIVGSEHREQIRRESRFSRVVDWQLGGQVDLAPLPREVAA